MQPEMQEETMATLLTWQIVSRIPCLSKLPPTLNTSPEISSGAKYHKLSSPCLGDGLAAPFALVIQRMPMLYAEVASTMLTNHLHHLFLFAAWLWALVCEDLSERGQEGGNVCFLWATTKLKHKCSNGLRATWTNQVSTHSASEGPTSPALGRQLRLQQQFSYLLLLCWIVFAVLIYVGSNHNIWDFSLLHWDRCVTEGTHWDLYVLKTQNTDQHHGIKELFRLKQTLR